MTDLDGFDADEAVDAAVGSGDAVKAIGELLKRSGMSLDEIGRVQRIRLSDYQTGYKDADGQPGVLDLKATSIVIAPSWDEGPKWEPPTPRQVKVTIKGARASAKPADTGLERALIVPDTQVHYRLVKAGTRSFELDPFHDLNAMATTVAVARRLRPDRIVLVGDTMDLPQFGRFTPEEGQAMGMNAALEDGHSFIAALRSTCERVDVIEGNHDQRMSTWALNNARQSYGIKRATEPHGSWPTMTVPYLLALDELDVTYHPGYPAATVDLGPRLRAVHGAKVRRGAIHADEGGAMCVVHGHTHHATFERFRHQGHTGPVESWVASDGALCRTDSAVPGVGSGTDPRTNRPVLKAQNWHQGLGVVTYDPESPAVMPRHEHVPILDGCAWWRDESITGTWSTDRDDRVSF